MTTTNDSPRGLVGQGRGDRGQDNNSAQKPITFDVRYSPVYAHIAGDAAWFRARPRTTFRLRPLLPGEKLPRDRSKEHPTTHALIARIGFELFAMPVCDHVDGWLLREVSKCPEGYQGFLGAMWEEWDHDWRKDSSCTYPTAMAEYVLFHNYQWYQDGYYKGEHYPARGQL